MVVTATSVRVVHSRTFGDCLPKEYALVHIMEAVRDVEHEIALCQRAVIVKNRIHARFSSSIIPMAILYTDVVHR